MISGVPVILIASASSYERHCVERALQKTGRSVSSVADTAEAERVCAENGGASILVIDSGLLEAPRDAQWRKLRRRHPDIGAVVCCPISPQNEIQRTDHNTLRVHPNNGVGICDALDLLESYRIGKAPAPWTTIRVLLIEDSLGDALMVTWRLERELGSLAHIALERAVTLEEGIDRLRKHPMDVVLLELNLPDSAGIDTVRRLRAADPNIPIVVLTSADAREVSERALQAGAQDCLTKCDFEAGPLVHGALRYAIERVRIDRAAFGFGTDT